MKKTRWVVRGALVVVMAGLAACAGTPEPEQRADQPREKAASVDSGVVRGAAPTTASTLPYESRAADSVAAQGKAANEARPLVPSPAVAPRAEATMRFAPSFAPSPYVAPPATWPGTDRFPDKEPGASLMVAEQPVSTFSLDVDTASYAFVRRNLSVGRLPPRDAVRVEEMVNYFPYAYPAPQDRSQPFRVTTTLMPSPWSAQKQLLHIGVRGYDLAGSTRPRANVVLLIDTSGSMSPPDRLPLLKQAFRLFASQLRAEDRVSIVTYAGDSRVALEPTAGSDRDRIVDAIDRLNTGGGTAGGEGLRRAYELAQRHFDPNAINRVMLATDGDFNVGITDPKDLERFIADKRKTGIYLSILGVGMGNLNDALTQRLAQAGNGNAAYIDTLLEARKVLSDELASTLIPIADDVKVQVEFNPAAVSSYRLIGYETRALRREDFNDDKVDAGDIGSGHTVTAIYEITPLGVPGSVDPLRYPSERAVTRPVRRAEELAFVKVRYKLPREATSRLIEQPVEASRALTSMDAVPAEQRFAVAVAAFGQRLRGESSVQGFSYRDIEALANGARGVDREGYRAEFVRLVRMADSMNGVAMR